MRVLVAGPASTGFIAKAAERTAPDGKVIVIRPEGEAMGRLEKRLAPLGFDHLVLETSPPGQIPLPDHGVDRAFLVMGLREIPSLDRTLEEIQRVVQPEGQLIVHRRFLFAGLLPRQRILRTCLEARFDPAASHGTLLQYTLTLEKRQSQDPAQGRSARTVSPGT
jgi:ubiquinone/menaquinone biosynthesis C-methylase UbiE